VTIVGDLPKDKALELLTRYLGSLPARARVSPDTYKALRALKRPTGPRVFAKEIDTPTAQAFVYSGFYGADETNVADARALSMAGSILSTRMTTEVREQAQLVYSIGAGSRPGTVFPGFGTFSAAAPTEPHKVAALVDKLASMYAAFAASGPTEEELAVAKKQVANTFAEQMKDPAWWLSRLERMTFRGTKLDDVLGAPAAYQAMTAKQVQETFAKYWSKEASIVVTVSPKAAPPAPKPADPVR
jgi:zinc protease